MTQVASLVSLDGLAEYLVAGWLRMTVKKQM